MKYLFPGLMALLLISSCGNSDKLQIKTVWMTTDPIQCLENPWEKEWTQQYPNGNYPTGDPRQFEEPEQLILRTHMLDNHDVTILRIRYKPYPEDAMVCEACTCPAGYSLYIEVAATDKDKLAETPFKEARKVPADYANPGN